MLTLMRIFISFSLSTTSVAGAEAVFDDGPAVDGRSRGRVELSYGHHAFRITERRFRDHWRISTRLAASIKADRALRSALDADPKLAPKQVFESRSHVWHGHRVCEYSLSALVITPGTAKSVAGQEFGGFELSFRSRDGKVAGEYRVDRDELVIVQKDERTIDFSVSRGRRAEILNDLRQRLVRVERLKLSIRAVGPLGTPYNTEYLPLSRSAADRFFHGRGAWARAFSWLPWGQPTPRARMLR